MLTPCVAAVPIRLTCAPRRAHPHPRLLSLNGRDKSSTLQLLLFEELWASLHPIINNFRRHRWLQTCTLTHVCTCCQRCVPISSFRDSRLGTELSQNSIFARKKAISAEMQSFWWTRTKLNLVYATHSFDPGLCLTDNTCLLFCCWRDWWDKWSWDIYWIGLLSWWAGSINLFSFENMSHYWIPHQCWF
jgi:hypothetical protein